MTLALALLAASVVLVVVIAIAEKRQRERYGEIRMTPGMILLAVLALVLGAFVVVQRLR